MACTRRTAATPKAADASRGTAAAEVSWWRIARSDWNSRGCARKIGNTPLKEGSAAIDAPWLTYTISSLL